MKLGSTTLNKYYLGTTAIQKAYIGSTVWWDLSGTPPPTVSSTVGYSFQYSLTTTDHLLQPTESVIPLDTTILDDTDSNGDVYSAAGGVLTIKEDGLYLIMNHLSVDRGGGSNRTSGESFLYINGVKVSGCHTDGFLRRASGSDEFSDTAYGLYELTDGDTVELVQNRINVAGSNADVVGTTTTNTPFKTTLTITKLNTDDATCILEGAVGDAQSMSDNDNFDDVTWTTQTRLDTGYTHTSGSANIQLDEAGRYLIMYSDTWERTVQSTIRSGVYHRLELDGVDVSGSYDNNYIRGSQTSEHIMYGNNSACTLIETGDANEIVKLKVAQEAGGLTLNRIPLSSRICIYKLPASAKSFKVDSTSVQNLGSTTQATVTYDNSEWIDTGFSLASNQVTVADATKMFFMQSVEADNGTGQRCEPFQWFAIDGVRNIYGSGSGYCRASGGTYKTTPNVGLIIDITAGQTVEVKNQSFAANATNQNRTSGSGAFCGLDLNSLLVE